MISRCRLPLFFLIPSSLRLKWKPIPYLVCWWVSLGKREEHEEHKPLEKYRTHWAAQNEAARRCGAQGVFHKPWGFPAFLCWTTWWVYPGAGGTSASAPVSVAQAASAACWPFPCPGYQVGSQLAGIWALKPCHSTQVSQDFSYAAVKKHS